jgi:hypothetical protein
MRRLHSIFRSTPGRVRRAVSTFVAIAAASLPSVGA